MYLHGRLRGLITLSADQASLQDFPEEFVRAVGPSGTRYWGYALWDRSQNQALIVQNACINVGGAPPCTRKALWLNADLEPVGMVELPGETLVKIKSGYSCFSCGCGCYSHQNIYAEGGNIFAHVWGYPVENDARGIYKLEQSATGPVWTKIISGQPQPPLAFSPRGDKVAYFELSWFGDRFVVAEISGHAR